MGQQSISRRGAGRRAFGRLVLVDVKDLSRTLQTGFAMLFLFLFYLLVIFVIDLAFSSGSTPPVVVVSAAHSPLTQSIQEELGARGIDVVSDASESNTRVSGQADALTVTLDASDSPPWREVWQAVRAAGVNSASITVVDSEGDFKVDLVRMNLGPALGVGLMAIAFVGTAVPLVSLRERGVLRLLGTTPVPNSALVMSLVPARVVVAAIEVAIVLFIAIARNYVDLSNVWRLALSMVLSLVMLLPLAFLMASKARNASSMQQGMAMLTMLLVSAGGGIIPTQGTPIAVQVLFNAIPTTWVMQAAGSDLADVTPFVGVPWLWCLMVVVGGIAFFLSLRMFSWDRERDEALTVRDPKRR